MSGVSDMICLEFFYGVLTVVFKYFEAVHRSVVEALTNPYKTL